MFKLISIGIISFSSIRFLIKHQSSKYMVLCSMVWEPNLVDITIGLSVFDWSTTPNIKHTHKSIRFVLCFDRGSSFEFLKLHFLCLNVCVCVSMYLLSSFFHQIRTNHRTSNTHTQNTLSSDTSPDEKVKLCTMSVFRRSSNERRYFRFLYLLSLSHSSLSLCLLAPLSSLSPSLFLSLPPSKEVERL